MKLHRSDSEFNCGIDLHTTSMYVCIMNRRGEILDHRKIAHNDLDYLLERLRPFMKSLTVCCESTPNWYFLYDFCVFHGVKFVLGHALYMRAISQSKVKNDKVDSQRIADLLRTNLLPEAYTCPKEYREARDLMRKRSFLVRKRTDLKNSLTMSTYMNGHMPPSQSEKQSKHKGGRGARQFVGGLWVGEVRRKKMIHGVSIFCQSKVALRLYASANPAYVNHNQPDVNELRRHEMAPC